jgi:hypothetical protein
LGAQPGEALKHPRLAKAIEAIQDARAYLLEAPPVFGGHKAAAIQACDEAIKPSANAPQVVQLREGFEV